MMEEERKCCSSKEHREGENNEELQQFDSDRKGGRGEEGGNGEGGRILAFLPSVRVHNWLRHVVHIRAHVLCVFLEDSSRGHTTEPRQSALSKQ